MTRILFNSCGPTKHLPMAFCHGISRLPSFRSCGVANQACHCVARRPLFPFNRKLDCASFYCNTIILNSSGVGSNRGLELGIPMAGANGYSNRRIIRICLGGGSSIRKPDGTLHTFGQMRVPTKGAISMRFSLNSGRLI